MNLIIPASSSFSLPSSHPKKLWRSLQGQDVVSDLVLDVLGESLSLGWEIQDRNICPPAWSDSIIDFPIYAGLKKATWAVPTKNGSRIPNPEQMLQISKIAHVADEILRIPGSNITCWLPSSNKAMDLVLFPRLMKGDAFCFCIPAISPSLPCLRNHPEGAICELRHGIYYVDARCVEV